MTDDWGYDRDNQWGVGIEVIQKEHYYNYLDFSRCFRASSKKSISMAVFCFVLHLPV